MMELFCQISERVLAVNHTRKLPLQMFERVLDTPLVGDSKIIKFQKFQISEICHFLAFLQKRMCLNFNWYMDMKTCYLFPVTRFFVNKRLHEESLFYIQITFTYSFLPD